MPHDLQFFLSGLSVSGGQHALSYLHGLRVFLSRLCLISSLSSLPSSPLAIVQTGAEIFSASFSSSPDYHIFPMMTAGNFLSSLPFSMLSPLQISFSPYSFSLLFSGSKFLFSYTQLRIPSISSVFSDISSSLSSVVSVCCSIQSLLLFSLSFSPFSQTELLSAVI